MNNTRKMSSGTETTVVAMLTALIATSLVGGCCHGGHMRGVGPIHQVSESAEAAAHASAVGQLNEAAASQVWSKDKERAFDLKLSQLPPDKSYALSLRLANLINTQKVRVDHGTPAPEGPPCTCSCSAGSHSTASKIVLPTTDPAGSSVASPLTPAVAPASATQKKP